METGKLKASQITFDPKNAKHFDLFNQDVEVQNRGKSIKDHNYRQFNSQFNEKEMEMYLENGMFVSERHSTNSFGSAYRSIWSDDLPVFITADSILHAWHHSFDGILCTIEREYLTPSLVEIMEKMHSQVQDLYTDYVKIGNHESFMDVEFFLCVGLSLLKGKVHDSIFQQGEKVAKILASIEKESMQGITLFGREKMFDFSQFKPRGHYEEKDLKSFFKAMMWCGMIEFRVAYESDNEVEIQAQQRGLLSSLIMLHLLIKTKKIETWREIDNVLKVIIGETDSMTFEQLFEAVKMTEIELSQLISSGEVETLRKIILSNDFGYQLIGSQPLVKSSNAKVVLPRTFTFIGQKFALDSWILSQTVFDRVLDEDSNFIQRRIPSCLDVAYTVFGNDNIFSELERRSNDEQGVKFRDNLPYLPYLAKLRKKVDEIPQEQWNESLYNYWLSLLRELSIPIEEVYAEYSALPPQVTMTEAWKKREFNTQMAGWTELRHDTTLFVKQGSTFTTCCEYPDGYVEPRPNFWRKFGAMCEFASEIITKIKPLEPNSRTKLSNFFWKFRRCVDELADITIKQAQGLPLSQKNTETLKTVMYEKMGSGGSKFDGWYPYVFFGHRSDCCKWAPMVTDVHTDPRDDNIGDNGCILHQAVGNVNMMFVAIDNGKGKDVVCYAGPVFSHYEILCDSRKSDSEWRDDIRLGKTGPNPSWTSEFLVTGSNTSVSSFMTKEEKKMKRRKME